MNVGMHKCNLCFPFPFDSRDVCFVEADTGIYSFFFVGGGGGCKTIFFLFGRGGGKPFAIEGQTADILRKIIVGNMLIHRGVL